MAVFPTPKICQNLCHNYCHNYCQNYCHNYCHNYCQNQNPEASPRQGNEISGCPGFPHPCYPDISGNSCRQSSRGRHPSGGEEEEEVSKLIGYARASSVGECLDASERRARQSRRLPALCRRGERGQGKAPAVGAGTLPAWRRGYPRGVETRPVGSKPWPSDQDGRGARQSRGRLSQPR